MKTVFLFTLTAILISCSTNQVSERGELLTSIHWTIEPSSPANAEKPNQKVTYRFFNDGTYTLRTEEVGVNGKWSWASEDEIYLEETAIVINGQANKFDASIKHYIRVIEISDKIFRTVERHEGDSWDSGFAKEINYIPEV
jgi:hypothetical protein